jgi:hypothetical protein
MSPLLLVLLPCEVEGFDAIILAVQSDICRFDGDGGGIITHFLILRVGIFKVVVKASTLFLFLQLRDPLFALEALTLDFSIVLFLMIGLQY